MKTNPLITRLKRKHAIIQREHQAIYDTIIDLRNSSVAGEISNSEIVDVAFMLKTMSQYVNDLRKEMDKIRLFVEKIACMRWMQSSMNEDPSSKTAQPIKGKLATGIPVLKTAAVIPSRTKDPDNYVRFMKRIGVFGVALKRNMVRVHWPLVIDYLSELAEKGKPMPSGIDPSKTYPMYSLMLREYKRKENNAKSCVVREPIVTQE